jgi:hypothetical protein
MKKNIIVKVLVSLIFLFSLLSWAVNTSATLSNNDNEIAELYSINGILVFKDQSTLDKTLDALYQMDRRGREAWEEKLNFVSQETLYNQINDAEIALEKKFMENTMKIFHAPLLISLV